MPAPGKGSPADVRHLVLEHRHREARNLGSADRADVGFWLVHGVEVGSECGGKMKSPPGGKAKAGFDFAA
jgi:hypothetical protein